MCCFRLRPNAEALRQAMMNATLERLSRRRSQRYFWTQGWQEGEQEASEDIRAGKVHKFSSADDAIAWLRSSED